MGRSHGTDAEASLTSGRRPSGVGGYCPIALFEYRVHIPYYEDTCLLATAKSAWTYINPTFTFFYIQIHATMHACMHACTYNTHTHIYIYIYAYAHT